MKEFEFSIGGLGCKFFDEDRQIVLSVASSLGESRYYLNELEEYAADVANELRLSPALMRQLIEISNAYTALLVACQQQTLELVISNQTPRKKASDYLLDGVCPACKSAMKPWSEIDLAEVKEELGIPAEDEVSGCCGECLKKVCG